MGTVVRARVGRATLWIRAIRRHKRRNGMDAARSGGRDRSRLAGARNAEPRRFRRVGHEARRWARAWETHSVDDIHELPTTQDWAPARASKWLLRPRVAVYRENALPPESEAGGVMRLQPATELCTGHYSGVCFRRRILGLSFSPCDEVRFGSRPASDKARRRRNST